MVILLLAACEPPAVPPTESAPGALDDVALLSRASIDLRARRPTEAEITAVEDDPSQLDPLLDSFVLDDAFPERIVYIYSEIFRTHADRFLVSLDNDTAFLDSSVNLAFRHAVGEEPLRIVAYVAENDRPFTEIVTADYTMANQVMLDHLPLTPVDPEGPTWRRARYLDERPEAGVLATSGMWWRYTSTYENSNRGRAMAIGRALLCDDRFVAAVSFQGTTVDLEERVREDPTCVGCHSTLDPLGSYLWGFTWRNQEGWMEVTRYDASNELTWVDQTGVPPGYYGQPGDDLQGLGQTLAADPRLVNCAVEKGMETLLIRPLTADDATSFSAHREDFIGGGVTLRTLYRSLIDDPAYRAADSDADGASPLRSMRPDQIAGTLEALTGFRWTWGGNDMLDTDQDGVRILAGGVDGVIATEPASDPSTTMVLVQERVAEAAAQSAVAREAALEPEERTLFREVSLTEVPTDADLATQVQALLLRCHSRRYAIDDAEVTSLVTLWQTLYAASGDVQTSWELVLSGILRHPDFVLY